MATRLSLVALSLSVLAAIFLLGEANNPPEADLVQGRPAHDHDQVLAAPAEPSVVRSGQEKGREVVVPGEPRLVSDTLADFWGAEWEAVREEFLEAGFEAELATTLPQPAPWEEVKDQVLLQLYPKQNQGEVILDQYRWEYAHTSEDLRQRGLSFGGELSAAELAEVGRIADAFDSPIVQASHTFADLIRMGVAQKVSDGDIRVGPHCLPPLTQLDDVIWQGVAIHDGWAASFALTGKEFPELLEQKVLLGALRHERQRSIQEYLNGR